MGKRDTTGSSRDLEPPLREASGWPLEIAIRPCPKCGELTRLCILGGEGDGYLGWPCPACGIIAIFGLKGDPPKAEGPAS